VIPAARWVVPVVPDVEATGEAKVELAVAAMMQAY
jgi:hypothetical protein